MDMGLNVSKSSDPSENHVASRSLQFAGHSDAVLCIAVAKTGRIMATGGMDRTVRLWDVPANMDQSSGLAIKDIVLTGHTRRVNCVAFEPLESANLASGSDDRSIIIWDARDGTKIISMKEHTGPVQSLVYHDDGSIMASGGADCSICLWDTTNQYALLRTLKRHTGYIFCLAFCCDGQLLASGSGDRTIKLWQCKDWLERADVIQAHSTVMCLAVSPRNPAILAAGTVDGAIVVCDVTAAGQLAPRRMSAHNDAILTLCFGSDGATFISAGRDRTLRLWRTIPSQPDDKLSLTSEPPNDTATVTGSQSVLRAAGQPECEYANRALQVSFSPKSGFVHAVALLGAGDACGASAHGDGSIQLTPLRGRCGVCGVRVERADASDTTAAAAAALLHTCAHGRVRPNALDWLCCECVYPAGGRSLPDATAGNLSAGRRAAQTSWLPTSARAGATPVARVRPGELPEDIEVDSDLPVMALPVARCVRCAGRRRLAAAMALHPRLGAAAPMGRLEADMLQCILDRTQ